MVKKNVLRCMLGIAFCLTFCEVCTTAYGEIQISMQEAAWSWEEKSAASFQGEILNDGETLSDVTLSLTVKTRLEDSGEIQFTHLNGKKLKIRQKAPTLETDLAGGNEVTTFSGEWFLPSSLQGGLAHAEVTLTILDQNGSVLKTGILEAGSEAAEEALIGVSPVKRVNQMTVYLIIACSVIWALAVGRYLALNRSSRKKGMERNADL